jgi:O-antigen ligase
MPSHAGLGGLSLPVPHEVRPPVTRAIPAEAPAGGNALPWVLLLVFLLLLFANLPLLVPSLAAVAPAQTVALAALGVLFVETSIARRPFRLPGPEAYLLLAFLGAAAVSSFSALWMRHSVEQTLVLLRFVAIFLLLVNTVTTWRRLRVTLAVMVAGGLFPALGALDNVRTGDLVEGRAYWLGFFANPNDLAFALVVLVPFALFLALEAKGLARIFFGATAATFVVAIFTTYSRSGLIALTLVLLLCFLRWSRPWARVPGLLAMASLMVLVVASQWDRPEGFAALVEDATVQQRLDTVRAGAAMFDDHPVLGVGLGGSLVGWPLYMPEGADSEGWLHSHNTFVQILAEGGIVGSALFLGLLAVALGKARRMARGWRGRGRPDLDRASSALEISLWGFLVCGLAGGYVLSWFPYLVVGLVSAAWLLPAPPPEEAPP